MESPNQTALIRRVSADSPQSGPGTTGLGDDQQRQSVFRLRVLALVYALVFLLADFLGYVFDPSAKIDSVDDWLPGGTSIVAGLAMAWMTTRSTIRPETILRVGLAFEVLGSLGIAMAESWGIYAGVEYRPEHLEIAGLSWVAVWMMLYTVVVPARPRTALLAASASGAMVPLTMALSMKFAGTSLVLTPMEFFGALIFPYGLVVFMAYVGARVIYRLGSDVARARRMGSYQLVEQLGQGGMGEVWRAEHRMLARPAVIKVIRPDVLDASDAGGRDVALQRFAREARATSSLRSPHTVELYDFGVSEEGTFYYVMELLEGLDLAEMINRFGPIPAERAVHLLKQVCHSLAEAHESGLIHRDIKPANIYACRYGREVDFVKVLDFGLVKRRRDGGADVALTADTVVGGTPAFIAPEQATGGHPVDARSDLYALGCVAYWLLTGEIVFRGDTAVQTIVMHVQEVPEPPSKRTEVEIPAALEEVILRCLEKHPDRRPQTAVELREALIAGDSGPPWSRERALRWWERIRSDRTESSSAPRDRKNRQARDA